MILGELVRIYKEHGDLPIYYRDFEGMMIEAGCHYIHSSIQGFHTLIIPCDEMETVMQLGTGKKVTRQKAQPSTLKKVVDKASDECDIPVYVKYFTDTDFNPNSARCEVIDGKLVFYNDKDVWDKWEEHKKRRDEAQREYLKQKGGTFDVQLPIIRNTHPQLLSSLLVGVEPISGPLPKVDVMAGETKESKAEAANRLYNSFCGPYNEKLDAAHRLYKSTASTVMTELEFWKEMAYRLAESADTASRASRKEHEHFLAYLYELEAKEKEFNFPHKRPSEIFQQWEEQKEKIRKKHAKT